MTINRTTLLDLPLPVTGTESGVWGDVTNNGLTQYLDIAIAGRNALTSANFTGGALTLATTEGDSSATNIAAGSAQYATLYVSSLAANSTITAPSSNRAYRVVNADATYTLTVKAAGQTGVVFPVNTSGTVVFNGTDYVLLGSYVIASAGTASLPSITFTGDTNTGIFSPAADTIAFSEGGVEAARFDSSGNLRVGTTSSLSVADKLTVVGGNFAVQRSSGITTFMGDNTTDGYAGTATNHAFALLTNSVERARIDSSGNVGIGTTSPGNRLAISQSVSTTFGNAGTYLGLGGTENSAGQTVLIGFGYKGSAANEYPAVIGYTATNNGGNQNGALVFGTRDVTTNTAPTERARIDSSGDLLVGTTSAVTSARAIFSRSSGANIVISSSVLSNGNSTYFSARNLGSPTRDCDIGVYKHAGITNSAGYVGYVEEEGTAQYTWVGNDGNFRISNDPANIGTNGGTVVGTQSSDERLKNIVGGLQYGLSQILALEPIAFAMKDSPNNKKIGFSAQQVQPIIPEAVYDTGDCIDGYDADPEYKMVQTPKSDRTKLAMEYTQIVPVLVKAIQEQQALITQLQADVAALKGTA